MTEKFPFLFQYLKKENISIDQEEFIFQIQSHSEYPSLLAISETLNFFNIENLITKLNFSDIVHLPKNFVALLKKDDNPPFLSLVVKTSTGFKYQDDKKFVNVSENELEILYQNIVLLAEKEEDYEVETNSKFINSILIVLGVVCFLGFLFFNQSNFFTYIFYFLCLVGIYFSVEAILKEIGLETKFSNTVCNVSSNSNCDAVINSKGVNFLEKFNYSNFSITFFIIQFLLFFVMQVANKTSVFFSFQFYLLLLSIPVTFLSIYHQVKIAKKWCTICLLIIGLLYTQIGVVYFLKPSISTINASIIFIFLFFFSIIYFFVTTIKGVLKIKNEQKDELLKTNRFKRNYKLFQLALNNSEKAEIKINSNSLIVGNLDAKLKITLITNPFCGFCKESHKIIENLLKIHKEEICINFQFNYNIENKNEIAKEIHHKFIEIYFSEGQESFMKALHNWFENKTMPSIEKFKIDELKINEILNQQFISNQNSNINFTPCLIINDLIYPKIYDRKDLIYYLHELIEGSKF